jgi:hypothetical protein
MPDVITTQQPGKPFALALDAPSPVYLSGEEALRITSYCNTSNVTLTINGRLLRADGSPIPINERHVPGSSRAAGSSIFPLSEGWLLGLVVTPASGVSVVGACWVVLDLVRGTGGSAQLVQTLGYGYVTTRSGFSWPGGVNLLGTDGPGMLRSIAGTTPAAGADISETVPTGARWEPISFTAQLVTGVAVGNRIVELNFDDGTTIYMRTSAQFNQVASRTDQYAFFQGSQAQAETNVSRVQVPIPVNARLAAGHRIRTNTTGLLAADQWSAVQYLVREWIEGS